MAPELDSAETPCFVNSCNVAIQMALMYISFPVWGVMAIFDCHDSWWQTMMGLQLFPPGVESWNQKPLNDGVVAYGDKIDNETEYDTFYNLRGQE